MAQPRPHWSIVVPVRGPAPYLGDALISAAGARSAEVLIQENPVEGRTYHADHDGHRANEADIGLYASLNRAIARSCGRWIHVLHADDWIEPHFYDRLAAAAKSSGAEVAFGSYECRRDGRVTFRHPPFREGSQGPEFLSRVLGGNPLQQVAIAFSREAWEKVGPYREDLPYCADWDWIVRAALRCHWVHEPAALAVYREHEGQDTPGLHADGTAAGNVSAVRRSIVPLIWRALHGR